MYCERVGKKGTNGINIQFLHLLHISSTANNTILKSLIPSLSVTRFTASLFQLFLSSLSASLARF